MSEIEVFEVQCGECEADFQIDSSQAGTTVHCPHCDSAAEIPTIAEIMDEEQAEVEQENAEEESAELENDELENDEPENGEPENAEPEPVIAQQTASPIPALIQTPAVTPAVDAKKSGAKKSSAKKKPAAKKESPKSAQKRQRPTEPNSNGPSKNVGGKVKASSARRSAQLLLKMSDILYYLACFVGVAWSVKVVGMLYPIVNYKMGSYAQWFIEATITTAYSAAFMGLLIAVAELIKVIVHIQENMTIQDQ